ncbi:MAG: hypothetical protein O7J95_20925 [Planctomycetota bacterium]|nr:hypothetical protein [Planctomycetota bacterium]
MRTIQLAGPGTRVQATAFAAALLLAVLPARGTTLADTVAETAPVLGRILEKRLSQEKITVGSLRWAHVKGRGLVYLGDVNLSHLKVDDAEPRAAEDNYPTWENARRELFGLPPARPGEKERTELATRAIQSTLRQFATRIPLAEGEDVRVVLYPASRCGQCHSRTDARVTAIDQTYWYADRMVGAGHHKIAPREYLVVGPERATSTPPGDQREDASVLARVFDKRLARAFPDEYWGVDRHGRSGAMGVLLEGWGPVVVLSLTFPFERSKSGKPTAELDLWEETRSELRGAATSPPAPVKLAKRAMVDRNAGILEVIVEARLAKKGKKIDQDRFLGVVKDVLADFAGRVRGLSADEEITVIIFGGASTGGWVGMADAHQWWNRKDQLRNLVDPFGMNSADAGGVRLFTGRPVRPAAPSYVLRIAASDLLPTPEGPRTREEVLEKIRVE